ncbi:hypothetical protein PLICRDRAFT_51133 [Plicaturopsis crispa FD-325 SS-3]|nr:hypothetical protein PLICRDRAFT_51133 [Plicaturopsis crispa FD-325 SS-3]
MSAVSPPAPSQETASLVKRLAGPSTNKAGLALDQSEINRIIAEASKGSKFYDNEKKKDKDLTLRIERILKERDAVRKGVDIAKVEHSVDQLLVDLEAQRDLSQSIVHVDMDAFFANVELQHNPSLAGKPFGVGHGVLTTASYEARKFGVRSAMPGFIAKKLCPGLILLDINPSRYSEMSKRVFDVFRRYDPNLEAAGCDEGYLNVTKYCEDHGMDADECVRQMREKVREETGLTVSAGIAPNKICSDKNKPNGQFHLPFERKAIMAFTRDLPIRRVQGVGRVNERLLDSIGIKTCGDIYTHRATLSLMDRHFGLRFLLRAYLGIASNVVQPGTREERKSIGAERTFNPLSDHAQILKKLDEVAVELAADMEQNGWTGRTVTLKFKLDTYQVFTRAKSFDRWITSKADLFATGKELLAPEMPLTLRLIGLRVTKLKDLQAPASGGIQRFFGPATSPRKKRKLGGGAQDVGDAPTIEHEHVDEEAMPGFHELDEEAEGNMLPYVEDEADAGEGLPTGASSSISHPPGPAAGPSKPHSAGPSKPASAGQSKPSSADPSKPRSTDTSIPRSAATPPPTQTCPLCSRAIEGDNSALNTHIDFCLSRGAIMAASAGGSGAARVGKRKK